MALPHRPFQTYIGFGRFFLEIPTIPIFCKFYVPDPRPRIRETRYILNFLVGTPYVEAVPSLKRHKLFILGVHPIFSVFPIAPISVYAPTTIEERTRYITRTLFNPFVFCNFFPLRASSHVDLPLIRRHRTDIIHVPRFESLATEPDIATEFALVLRSPRHVVAYRPSTVPLSKVKTQLLLEGPVQDSPTRTPKAHNDSHHYSEFVMDPFIICISETLPIRPFPSSYLASAQWISIQGRIIKEVPKQCDIRAILEIAHEVLAGRKVIGAPVSTEGVFAHNVKAGSLAISSTPPIFYLSPQPPLSFTAEVNAFQKVSTIDHLVLGEVDQDDLAAPETASTGFSDEASRSDDVETTLCISTSMTFSVSSRYDSAIGYTKLDISTMDAPDLFDDVAEPKVPQVRLSTDTDYFRKLAPEATYSSDGDNIERNPEPPVTKLIMRHKQRAGASIKFRPPHSVERIRVKNGRVLGSMEWVVGNHALKKPQLGATSQPASKSASKPGRYLNPNIFNTRTPLP